MELSSSRFNILNPGRIRPIEVCRPFFNQFNNPQFFSGDRIGDFGRYGIKLKGYRVFTGLKLFIDVVQAGLNIEVAPDDRRFDHFQLTSVIIEHKAGIYGFYLHPGHQPVQIQGELAFIQRDLIG